MTIEKKIAVAISPDVARHAARLLAGAAPTSAVAGDASEAALAMAAQAEGTYMVGDALGWVDDILAAALAILANTPNARMPSGLEDIVADLEALRGKVDEVKEDIACITCGDFNNDGEGEDGYCGNCADTHYDDEGHRIKDPEA